MSDDYYRTHPRGADGRDTLSRVRAYLSSRPLESWLFFFAGLAAGSFLG